MTKIIHKSIFSLTPSSGSVSGNTTQFLNGLLREVLASPATSSARYDLKITSPEGLVIYQVVSQVGDLADEVVIPIRGIHTVSITNATVDVLFNVNLVVDE